MKTKTIYISEDGTEFENEKDAINRDKEISIVEDMENNKIIKHKSI